MAIQASDIEGSRIGQIRTSPELAPRQRRAVGEDPRRGQVLTTKVGLQMPHGDVLRRLGEGRTPAVRNR